MTLEGMLVRVLNYRCRPPRRLPSGFRLGNGHVLITSESRPVVLPGDIVEHSFISGRTGSGKTTLLLRLMQEHLRLGVPFFFIDFHGEATEKLLRMLAGLDRAVILLEPWGETVIGWNPLAMRGDESPYALVQELIAIFHRRLWSDSWGPRLEEVLRNTLLPLAEQHLTLLEATPFLTRPEFRRLVLSQTSIPEVREFWMLRFERLSPSQRSLVTETVLNKLSVFHDPAVKFVIGQERGTLDFDQALAKGESIIANLSSGRLRGNNFLLASLLVATLKQAVYRRRPGSPPFSIFLDEFQEMIALDSLDDYLRSFRKFGCSVYLATQQLEMPSDLKSAIFANSSRFFAFATSAADAAFFARELGGGEGSIAAELLPELKRGQSLLKERGKPTLLLSVAAPTAPEKSAAEGRAQCLELGVRRRDIERRIAERTSRLQPKDVPRKSDTTTKEEEPEGYEGF